MSRRFWSIAGGVAWRAIHNVLVKPSILVPSLIFPLFFLIAFGGGLSSVSRIPNFDYPPGYTAFQYVFVFLQSAAFAGVFTGFAIARDFESGFARRLLLAATHRGGIVVGYVLGALARWLMTGTLVTIAALIGGMSVPGAGVDLFGLLGLGVLTNLASALWGAGVAMRLRTEQAGSLIQMPVFIVLFLAPVYVPLHLLKGWVHAVASVNPATALLEAGRSLLAGSPVHVALAFAAVLGAIALMGLWARGGLRSAERAG